MPRLSDCIAKPVSSWSVLSGSLMITTYAHRRPRAHLFSFSPRGIALIVAFAIGAAVGLGLLTARAHSAPAPATTAPPGFVWVRG